MARTYARLFSLTALLMIASLVITAVLMIDIASAEPKQTKTSMSSRVQSQRELCETIGGGQMDYVNSYENGKLVGVTTYCKGGTQDGWNCANTATTYDCWQGPKSRTVLPPTYVQDLPEITAIEGEVEADTGSVAQPAEGSVLENPDVSTEPIEPSVEQRVRPMPVLLPLE